MTPPPESPTAPALLAIVLRLRAAGLPVSVGQYLEGLRALERLPDPFRYLAPVARAGAGKANRDRQAVRDRLVWLVQTLWARSDEERRLVRNVIERDIAPPPPALSLGLADLFAGRDSTALVPPEPAPAPKPVPDDTEATARGGAKEPADGPAAAGGLPDPGASETPDTPGPPQPVPVPPLADAALAVSGRFAMTPTPVLSPLWMTSVWRRLQEPHLVEDRRAIDLNRTVARTVRNGGLMHPAFGLRRVNRARLLVLIDQSAAMQPWAPFARSFAETLDPANSRIRLLTLRYFSGAPGERLFLRPDLRGPTPRDADLARHEGDPVLIFGEAGAVRFPRSDFGQRLDGFFSAMAKNALRPVVWINPMPPECWNPSFAALPGRHSGTHVLPLGKETLLRAVDLLRGQAE